MPVAPTFALGPPPSKDDPSYDNWVNLMWKWIRYLSSNAGSGTVTSVAQTVPAEFSVAGSPITTTGTLAISKATQSANTVWAGPTSGSVAQPAFRAIVAADIPQTFRTALGIINANAAALPTPPSGTIFQIGNADGTVTGMGIDCFAAAPQLLMRRSQGTAASPTAITSGQAMFNFGGGGRAATVFNNASMLIQASATENWTDSANGTQVTISTTPNGSTTRGVVATFGQDATFSLTNALTVANGGTGATTLTGLLTGNGTSAVTAQTYTPRTNWTPTLKFGGATTGITYAVQAGSYVQLAGVVYFTLNVTLTSKGSATGAATFTGLPVTSYASASQIYLVQGDGFSNIALAFLAGSSTTLALYSTATAAWDNTNVANDSVFRISGFYFA